MMENKTDELERPNEKPDISHPFLKSVYVLFPVFPRELLGVEYKLIKKKGLNFSPFYLFVINSQPVAFVLLVFETLDHPVGKFMIYFYKRMSFK